MGKYLIEGYDLKVRPLDYVLCEDCGEDRAVETIHLDLRGMGQEVFIGNFCRSCSKEFEKRFKSSCVEK